MATSVPQPTGQRFIVIIADDEVSVRASIRAILKPLPLDCFDAEDGFAAMEAIDKYHPDLLILDYALPGCDGLEVLRQVRRDPALTTMKVVFISG